MTLHPAIHADFLRGHERDLRRRLARPGRSAAKRTNETSAGLAELVESARSGDPQAWESLVTRLSPMLRRVAHDYRLSVADIDDVVQATWAAAFTNILQLREPEAISGWLCVTARRQALRILRSRRLEIAVEDPRQPDEPDHPLFESALVQAEQLAAVHEAVDRLPDPPAIGAQGPARGLGRQLHRPVDEAEDASRLDWPDPGTCAPQAPPRPPARLSPLASAPRGRVTRRRVRRQRSAAENGAEVSESVSGRMTLDRALASHDAKRQHHRLRQPERVTPRPGRAGPDGVKTPGVGRPRASAAKPSADQRPGLRLG